MSVLNKVFASAPSNPDDVRMTLGEHLEELRTRLIRALIGLFVGTVVCYMFIDYLQAFLMWPVFAIYRSHGLPAEIRTMAPAEQFMTDLKVALIIGLIVSAPYSIMQIWGFIAAGLYPHERRWVRAFAPVSIILFFTGAVFLIVVVNPLLLKFLLTYRTDLPDVARFMPSFLVASQEGVPITDTTSPPATAPNTLGTQFIPSYKEDPQDVADGVLWLNGTEREIRVRYGDKVYAVAHVREVGHANRVVPDIRFSEIIPFTLQLAAAFGIGFQVPVVVAFLAVLGIFSADEMARFRRHVILIMAIAAAVFTPSPDPFSMMLLLLPMVGLFEAGLFVARRIERSRAAAQTA
ncbi:MAG TPA: twin-arginine translocase subunit TatC [Phycisphaerae bacterium]|nr:twin-arginine translocase subunit TatC [Phycisphaerae bacterium]HOJ76233.1 twin-arginine translocase subunit TatC [Phycisphaerae bacterium]HPP28857.1 twin-arginine translocase subunit TatC [Phycisphaerae bacterium]HQE27610.1 twin-arginine translocase subunit TatC [Phycisphaerae bacterium]